MAPNNLSRALWRPTSSLSSSISPSLLHQAAPCTAPVCCCSCCSPPSAAMARCRAYCDLCLSSALMLFGVVIACSNDSAPQRPQPVRPTKLRRRSFSVAKGSAVMVNASSMPLSVFICSQSSSCLGEVNMPSLRLNPSAKSSRSLGADHHHHMGDAVVDHGYGCFCGDKVGSLGHLSGVPDGTDLPCLSYLCSR